MFRPRGFAPPRRLSPRGSCGSVAPRNRSRVHRVSSLPARGGRPKAASMPGTVPAVRFAPSEEFPSSAAGHASLRPLPSCRYRPARREVPAEAGVHRPRSPLMRGAYSRETNPGDGALGAPKSSRAGSRGPPTRVPKRPGGLVAGAPKSRSGRVLRGDTVAPKSGGPVSRRCGSYHAGRGRRGSEEPGVRTRLGRGRAELRRAPSPDPGKGQHLGSGGSGGAGTGRRGSEEPRRRCPE
jgi:hypothetical protein